MCTVSYTVCVLSFFSVNSTCNASIILVGLHLYSKMGRVRTELESGVKTGHDCLRQGWNQH